MIAALLAALIVAAYSRVFFLGQTFVERDALRLKLPSREFLVESLRSWRIPEWFDGVGFGSPFAANPVHEVLAPLGWTMALLPGPWGFDVYDLIHVWIGGLGAAALAYRVGAGRTASFVAGASLALGGYVTSMVPNGLVPALAWTPWVAWSADRLATEPSPQPEAPSSGRRWRAGAIVAAFFSLQLLAGEPASILIAGLVAGILVVVRSPRPLRDLMLLLIAAVAAVLLAAIAIAPGLVLLSDSARGAGIDERGLEWSLHPGRLLELVWPMAFGSQVGDGWYAGLLFREGPGDPFWSFSLYLGMPLLLAAAAAWRDPHVRRLLLASLLFLLVAVGPLSPIFPLLQRVFPPLRLVNFPEKFVYGALLLWTIAAARGLGGLLASGASRAMRRMALAAAAVLASAVVGLALWRGEITGLLAARADEWGVLLRPGAGVATAIRGGCVAAAAMILFSVALALHDRSRRWATGLAVLSVLGPLSWAAGVTTPLAARSVVAEPPAVLRPLATRTTSQDAARPRLFRFAPQRPAGPFATGDEIAREYHESLDTNIAARFGLAIVPGFEPGQSVRLFRFGREILPGMSDLAAIRLLGIEWLAAAQSDASGLPFPVLSRAESGWVLLSTGSVRPRAFVTPRWRTTSTPEGALRSLAAPGREDDPAAIVVVDPGPGRSATAGPLEACDVSVPRPEDVHLRCESRTGGYAVLLDEWAPGWSATVNGRPVEIDLVDGLFRGLAIDPGRQEILFRYRTPGLRTAAAISLASWLIWCLLMIWTRPSDPAQSGSGTRR